MWHNFSKCIVFVNQDNSQFWGPFLGAFFAFIFGLAAFAITNRISKKAERVVKHKNAMVKIEQMLQCNIDEIAISKYTSKSIQEILEKGVLVSSRFNNLTLINEVLLELADIGLVNKYFSYSRSVTRFNLDFSSINYSLTRLEDAFLSGMAVDNEKKIIIAALKEKFSTLDHLEAETKEFLGIVRLHLNYIKQKTGLFGSIFMKFNYQINPEDLSSELINIEKEIDNKEAM